MVKYSLSDGPTLLKSILFGALISSILALLFQFIGFVTPGWITLASPTGMTVNAGVWYIQVCIPPRCRTASMTRVVNPFNVAGDNAEDFVNWTELQVETTLAFVSIIVALILAINALVHVCGQPRLYLAWEIVTAVISGALLLIPVGRLSDVILDWKSHIIFQAPYSLICSALGSGFAFLSAVFSIVGLCLVARLERQRKSQEEQDHLTMAPS